MTIGVDIFETSLKTLAISTDHEGKTYLAAIEKQKMKEEKFWLKVVLFLGRAMKAGVM